MSIELHKYLKLPPDLVLYHAKCSDGIMSALIHKRTYDTLQVPVPLERYHAASAKETFRETVDRIGWKPPEGRPANIHVLDLSYFDIGDVIPEENYTALIVDHHETAIKTIKESIGWKYAQPFGYIDYGNNAFLDRNHSAAGLVWRMFNPMADTAPEIVNLVEDRDLWKWNYGYLTQLFYAATESLGHDLKVWLDTIPPDFKLENFPKELLEDGKERLAESRRYQFQYVADNRTENETIEGTDTLLILAPPKEHSEIGNIIAASDICRRPVAMFYPVNKDGTVTMSVRSVEKSKTSALELVLDIVYSLRDSGFDPLPYGGHVHAASVTMPLGMLPRWAVETATRADPDIYKKRN